MVKKWSNWAHFMNLLLWEDDDDPCLSCLWWLEDDEEDEWDLCLFSSVFPFSDLTCSKDSSIKETVSILFTNIQNPLTEHFEYTCTGPRLQRVWLRRVLNKMNKVFSRDEIPVNDINLKKDWLQ